MFNRDCFGKDTCNIDLKKSSLFPTICNEHIGVRKHIDKDDTEAVDKAIKKLHKEGISDTFFFYMVV